MTRLLFLVFFVVATGCSSLSKDDCANMDWNQKGFEDGKGGGSEALIDKHTKACGDHGVSVNREAWRKSFDEGIKAFCTEPQGFLVGRQGRMNPKTCTGPLAHDFDRGYKRGYDEFEEDESKRKQAEEEHERQEEESRKQSAIAAAYSRSECSSDSDCGDRECRRSSEFVEGQFIDVGTCN